MVELSRTEFEEKLAEYVAMNPEFREKLLKDPKKALEDIMGVTISEKLSITVHQEDESTLHFVLPPQGDELSASELESVGGGACYGQGCAQDGCSDYDVSFP